MRSVRFRDTPSHFRTVRRSQTNSHKVAFVEVLFAGNNNGLGSRRDSCLFHPQRTDPRGVITTYGFDNLNRLTSISYNVGSTGVPATATVSLTYDQGGSAAYALGRLTSMTDGVGSETYSYNNLGEMT